MSEATDVVMSRVQLPDEMIKTLCGDAAFAARILQSVRTRMVQKLGNRTRVPLAEVMQALEDEINGFRDAATPEHWKRDTATVSRSRNPDKTAGPPIP